MRHLLPALALLILIGVLITAASPGFRRLAADYLTTPAPPAGGTGAVIVKSTNRLYLFEDGRLIRRYDVATGREPSFTPEGAFRIVNRTTNPEESCYGTRWMGLSVPESHDRLGPPGDPRAPTGRKYGIHGTDEPWTIGGYYSGGCVRLKNEDVEELYDRLDDGAVVEIRR
jgi:hypothetical protein